MLVRKLSSFGDCKMAKGKVLQICAIDLTVDKLLKPLIIESNKKGFETHIACTDTGLFSKLEKELPNLYDIKIDRSISIFSNIKSIYALYKLMRKEKYDIVHVHTPIAALLGRVAAKLAGVKNIVYTAHGFYFHEDMSKKQYNFYYNIEKYAAKFMTDWLLLQSKEDYQLSVENKFLNESRIIHLSNGVDLEDNFNPGLMDSGHISALKNEIGIQPSDIVFSFIGRLVEEKGVLELLRAFGELKEHHSNVKLLLIGDLPNSERDISAINEIKRLMNQEGVIPLGFRDDISQLLYLSNVFILPSYREGLPRSIIEAMAMENAIIATNIRGCREQVFEENGLLIDRRSSEQLVLAMETILDNPDKIERMGIASREIALELFNEEKVLGKQMELFGEL